MRKAGGCPRLSVARVEAADPLFAGILETIRRVYGRPAEPVRRDVEERRAAAHAIFEAGRRAGFLILSDWRDPRLHIGNRIDPRLARAVLEDPRRRIWVVAYLHGEPGTAHELAELGEAALRAAAGADPDRSIFLVSLGRGGDPRSWRLFRELGFREEGPPGWLGEIAFAAPPPPSRPRADLEIAWLDRAEGLPAEALALAYDEIFGEGHPILSAADIRAIASGPEWSGELSLAVRDRGSGEWIGLLFAGRREGASVHIDCAGIRRAWRGRGVLEAGFEAFRGRAIEMGIRRATFVTGISALRRLVERRFGGRILDELVWLVRRGAGGP